MRTCVLSHRDDPEVAPLFALAFDKRPEEELYVLKEDPYQLHNVAQKYPQLARTMNRETGALPSRSRRSQSRRQGRRVRSVPLLRRWASDRAEKGLTPGGVQQQFRFRGFLLSVTSPWLGTPALPEPIGKLPPAAEKFGYARMRRLGGTESSQNDRDAGRTENVYS